MPVQNKEKLTGVLFGTFSVERLTGLIKDLKFLENGYGQLVAQSGMLIADPEQVELEGKLNLLEKMIQSELKLQQSVLDDRLITMVRTAIESDRQTKGLYNFVDGVEKVGVCTPINLPGEQRWIMTVAAPSVEMTHSVNALVRTMLGVAILCLISAILAILFIAKLFVKPIIILRDDCLLLAKGDLRER